jgi:hypothetical protein
MCGLVDQIMAVGSSCVRKRSGTICGRNTACHWSEDRILLGYDRILPLSCCFDGFSLGRQRRNAAATRTLLH